MRGEGRLWFVLRTSGPLTVPMSRKLRREGYEVWTPVERKRNGRGNVRRIPVMPSYIFAPEAHLDNLYELAERTELFSVFCEAERVPIIEDGQIRRLRVALLPPRKKPKQETFEPGAIVRIPEGIGAGLSGQVVYSDGKWTLVCFGGSIDLKISTFKLKPNSAISVEQARAA